MNARIFVAARQVTPSECIDACFVARQRARDDFDDGARAGVAGSPGNILRGNESGRALALPGAAPCERIRGAVERLLALDRTASE